MDQFMGRGQGEDWVMRLLGKKIDTRGDEGDEKEEEGEVVGDGDGGSGWDFLTIHTKSELITCTNVVGTYLSTELVEPSGFVTEGDMLELLGRLGDMRSASKGGG